MGLVFIPKKLFDCFAKEQWDRLLILGDILYHGPRNDLPKGYAPKEVIQMVNAHAEQIVCVQGNCDCEVGSNGLRSTNFKCGHALGLWQPYLICLPWT